MKRTVADFLDGFVLPLVAGGEMNVGKPISEPEIRMFCRDLPHASVEADKVDDARANVVAELVVRPPPLILDEDELHLAAAVHNLLYLSHPDAESWAVTKGMERRVLDTASAFAKRALTVGRRKVLARHGLLHNVFDISRTDLTIKWWTGRATFYGQEPPKRLIAWRSLRRVTQENTTASFSQLFGTELVAPVMHTLVRRTPLTILLNPLQMGAALGWEETVFLLRDAELARAVAYRAIEADNPSAVVAAPAVFASAFEQMLERNPLEPDVRAVAAFLVHLNALLAVGEADARDPRRSALLNVVLAPDRAASRPRGLTGFFALPAAVARVDRRLAEPPGLDSDRRVAARWQQHRAQVEQDVGEAVIETLAGRLARHLTVPVASGERAAQ
ncbi:MAG: hypothetical protein KJO07_07525 [Deltaproteobacteria bacterium]|nr:hypothetical protein [Deltaproteobacteria bacterium]